MQITIRVTWANYLADLGDFEEVDQHLTEISRLQSDEDEMGDKLNWSLHCLMGKLALAERNTDKAIEYLHMALEFAQRSGDSSYVADTMGILAETMHAAGAHANANRWDEQAESLRKSISQPRTRPSGGLVDIAQSWSLVETIGDRRADSLRQIIKTFSVESNGAEATGRASKQPAESTRTPDAEWSALMQSHSPSSMSRESQAMYEAIAEEMSACVLLLRITGGQDILAPIKGAPSLLEVKLGSENMSSILDIIRFLGQPAAQAELTGIARHLSSVGIEMRQQGKHHTALLCYRFALAVATHYRDWFGIESLTWNTWVTKESIKDSLRVNVTPPFPDGPASATLTQLDFLAGNMIQGPPGPTMQSEENCLLSTAELIREDAQLLLSTIGTGHSLELCA